jgi:hypothetical protein
MLMAHADVDTAVIAEGDRVRIHRKSRLFGIVPGFVFILAAYIVGKLLFHDPRGTLLNMFGYKISWAEILLLGAAVVAMAEQVKVAKPGVNNTTEVLLMGAIAIIQLLLFALGAAKVEALAIFDTTEFLILTLINLAQTAVAYQINSATLMRTISSS